LLWSITRLTFIITFPFEETVTLGDKLANILVGPTTRKYYAEDETVILFAKGPQYLSWRSLNHHSEETTLWINAKQAKEWGVDQGTRVQVRYDMGSNRGIMCWHDSVEIMSPIMQGNVDDAYHNLK
jgi:hypothetical protein